MRDVLSNQTFCDVTRVINNLMYCAMFWGGCERSQLPKMYSITQVLVQLSPHCGALCRVEYIFMHVTFGFRSHCVLLKIANPTTYLWLLI